MSDENNLTPTTVGAPKENASSINSRATFAPLLRDRITVASKLTDDFLERQLQEQLRFLEPADGERIVIEALASPTASSSVNHYAWVRNDDMVTTRMSELVRSVPNGPPLGLFIHVDPIQRDCTAKLVGNRWSRQGKGTGFSSKDVSELRVLKIDVDADRAASGTSATNEEMTKAIRLAGTINCDLAEILGGDSALAFLFSGNGVQIHVRLENLANEEATVNSNKRILEVLDAIYTRKGEAHIDTVLFEPRRLVPLAGTMKRKGADDPELGRRHRPTWIAVPERTTRLSREALERLLHALEARLTDEQRANLDGKGKKAINQSDAVSATDSIDSGDEHPWVIADRISIRDVLSQLGHDGETCPNCLSSESVSFPADTNIIKCFRSNECRQAFYWPTTAVAKLAFGVDLETMGALHQDKDLRRQVMGWFHDRFPQVPAMRGGRQKRQNSKQAVVPSAEPIALGPDNPIPSCGTGDEDSKPIIRLGPDTDRVVAEAVEALASDTDVYVQGASLARLLTIENVPRVALLPLSNLTSIHLARVAVWQSFDRKKSDWVRCRVSSDIAQAVKDLGSWPKQRRIVGVVRAPVMRRDGSLLDTPGYDAATGLVYAPSCDFGSIPENPTAEEIENAKSLLMEVIADFPMNSSGRASWMAILIGFFGRAMFDGPSPAIAIDANGPGVGKGLLVSVTGRICLGGPVPITTPTEQEEELRKRITSTLIAGRRIVVVDNLPGTGEFGNAIWDALFTSSEWEDRILGVSEMVVVPNLAIWIINGNNIALKGDTVRRVIHLRLESDLEHPELRTGFKHSDIASWVEEQRAALVRAILTLLRGWVCARRPSNVRQLGSFEGWSSTISACIEWLGYGDVVDTQREYAIRRGEGGDAATLKPLLLSWLEAFGNVPMSSGDVIERITDEDRRVLAERRRLERGFVVLGPEGSMEEPAEVVHTYAALRKAILGFAPGRNGGLPNANWLGRRIRSALKRNAAGLWFDGQANRTGVFEWVICRDMQGQAQGYCRDIFENVPAPNVSENQSPKNHAGTAGTYLPPPTGGNDFVDLTVFEPYEPEHEVALESCNHPWAVPTRENVPAVPAREIESQISGETSAGTTAENVPALSLQPPNMSLQSLPVAEQSPSELNLAIPFSEPTAIVAQPEAESVISTAEAGESDVDDEYAPPAGPSAAAANDNVAPIIGWAQQACVLSGWLFVEVMLIDGTEATDARNLKSSNILSVCDIYGFAIPTPDDEYIPIPNGHRVTVELMDDPKLGRRVRAVGRAHEAA